MHLRLFYISLTVVSVLVLGYAVRSHNSLAAKGDHTYTGRVGDVFRTRAALTQCEVSEEAGAVYLKCSHIPRARYSVVFYKNDLFVYKNGNPDNPVFSARGKP
jgi:hypothetical protein